MSTNRMFPIRWSIAAGFAALGFASLLPASLHAVSVKFTSSGTFTPPAGITNVTVECWGGGGAGGGAFKNFTNSSTSQGKAGGGGAGAGAYAKKLNVPVTPGTPYPVTISPEAVCPINGFTNGQTFDGASVTFTGNASVSVTANGGQGGACAITTNSTSVSGVGGAGGAISGLYDVEYAGGGGHQNTTGNSGAGGSAASDLANGVTATTQSTGGNLNATVGSDTDHNGGKGTSGKSAAGSGNTLNTQPGGAGGGAMANAINGPTSFAGSNGKQGQIIISYSGGTLVKANNTTNLNLSSSWVGGSAPGLSDTAKWDATVTSANTTSLGTNLAWGSILIADPAGLVTINAGNTLTNNGAIDMSAATADLTLKCSYVLGNSAVWSVPAGRMLTVSGAISGASSKTITMVGDGMVILSGSNTYSGSTTLSAGSTGCTLKLGASNVIPDGTNAADVTVGFGCTLDLNGNSEVINGLNGNASGSLISYVDNTAPNTTNTLTVGGVQSFAQTTFNGVLQNTGSGSALNFVKTGTNQLILARANTLTGTVTVSGGGNLTLNSANPVDSISGLTIGGGSTLGFNSGTILAPIMLNGNASFRVQAAGGVETLNGAIGGTGDITFNTGENTLSAQKVVLGAAGNFAGNVTLTSASLSAVNSMTLQLAGGVNTLPTTAVVTLDGYNATGSRWCDLDLNGNDQTLAGLTTVTRSGRLQRVYSATGPATLTISNNASYSFGGTLGNSGAGGDNLALVKSGAGTFTLSGANTYANGTIISGGTLLVNNTNNSGTGSGTVTISSGATLGGSGTIDGAVTNNAGGTLSPGTSIGTLTLNGDLILEPGSTNTFEVDGTALTNDAVALNVGAVTYGGVLKIVPSGSFTVGQEFQLFSGAGATSASNFDSLRVSSGGGLGFTFTNGVLKVVSVAPPPQPPIGAVSVSGGNLTGSVPTVSGYNYVLQTTTNLTTPIIWTSISTNAGTGSSLPFSVPVGTDAQKFVRFWVY